MNPPDFFMSKMHHENPENVQRYPEYFNAFEKFQSEDLQNKMSMKLTNQVALREVNVGFFAAMGALIHRSTINTIRNPMLLKSKIFQSIFMALFVGGLFFNAGTKDYTNLNSWQYITGFLFFLTINSLMMTLSPITLTFPL